MRLGAAAVIAAALAAAEAPTSAQVAPSPAEVAAYTGLHAAAQRGEVGTIQDLAAANPAALESRDTRGRTPLHVATFARQRAAIGALAKAGASLSALENDRYDPVTVAAVANDEETLRLLLSLAVRLVARCRGRIAKLARSREERGPGRRRWLREAGGPRRTGLRVRLSARKGHQHERAEYAPARDPCLPALVTSPHACTRGKPWPGAATKRGGTES